MSGRRFTVDSGTVAELLRLQDGVVTRRQLFERGAQLHDLQRMVRRRELSRIHPGVYVDHTGPLTRRQREWAAVLAAWPAALAGASALPRASTGSVHIAVARARTVRMLPGVVVRRTTDLQRRVQWNRAPPRLRVEHAAIDVMSEKIHGGDVAAAFAVLADVAQSRQTTADRLLTTLEERRRVPGRRLIAAMLADLRDGVCSVLERGYRHEVEHAHGLPPGSRQHPSTTLGTRTHQDVRYPAYSLVVELDGHAFHADAVARDHDAARDLAELARSGAPTARVTYGLVFTTPCRTASWIAQILHGRGWLGALRLCPRCPPDH